MPSALFVLIGSPRESPLNTTGGLLVEFQRYRETRKAMGVGYSFWT